MFEMSQLFSVFKMFNLFISFTLKPLSFAPHPAKWITPRPKS